MPIKVSRSYFIYYVYILKAISLFFDINVFTSQKERAYYLKVLTRQSGRVIYLKFFSIHDHSIAFTFIILSSLNSTLFQVLGLQQDTSPSLRSVSQSGQSNLSVSISREILEMNVFADSFDNKEGRSMIR